MKILLLTVTMSIVLEMSVGQNDVPYPGYVTGLAIGSKFAERLKTKFRANTESYLKEQDIDDSRYRLIVSQIEPVTVGHPKVYRD